jgi:hypothetical protein
MPELVPAHPAVTRNLHKNRSDVRGDLSIRALWNRGTDCIIDVRVTDTDARSNLSKYISFMHLSFHQPGTA